MAHDRNPRFSDKPGRGTAPFSSSPLGAANLVPSGTSISSSWDAVQRHPRLTVASLGLHGACLLVWFGWPREQPRVALASQCEEAHSQQVAEPEPEPPVVNQAPALAPQPLHLADGSTVELHGVSSMLHSEELSEERVRLRLTGGARFEVAPDPERSFVVANTQVLVRAMDTSFSMDPDGLRTRVAVEHGRAQIIWRRGAMILSAGEAAVFPPESEPAFGPLLASVERSEAAQRPKRVAHAAKRKHKHKHEKHAKTRAR